MKHAATPMNVRYSWAGPSVPPPHHYEYEIALEHADDRGPGRGEVTFVPDYPMDDVPQWREEFAVPAETLGRIERLAQGLLEAASKQADADMEGQDASIGGETSSFFVQVEGEEARQVHTALGASSEPVRSLARLMRDVVPLGVWKRMDERRHRFWADVDPGLAREIRPREV